jgi:hypothetical protein
MNQGVHVISTGVVQAVQLADRKALRSLVAQHFGFDLPELETMRVKLLESPLLNRHSVAEGRRDEPEKIRPQRMILILVGVFIIVIVGMLKAG